MPKKRILPFIILGIVSNRNNVTGNEITTEFNTEIGDFWKASHSQIYPELRRMVSDQWISVTTNEQNAKEKYYSITQQGKQVFNDWLNQPVQNLPVQQDIFSLKLFFIKDPHDQRIAKLIDQQLRLLNENYKYLQGRMRLLFDKQENIQSQYGHYLILARAVSRTAGQIEWLKQIQNQRGEK